MRKSEESNREMAMRAMELVQKWMGECTMVQGCWRWSEQNSC